MHQVSVEDAKNHLIHAFQAVDVPEDESLVVSESLLDANLTGYDTHGIIKLPYLIEKITSGVFTSVAKMEILKQTDASAYIDCHSSLGPVTAQKSFELASEMAKKQGVGLVSCINSTYVCRLGGFVDQVAQNGLIAVLMANDAGGDAAVTPCGGTAPFFSTNPLAVGIPRDSSQTMVIDISTSITAIGKLILLNNQNQKAKEGWLINAQGDYETDLSTFFANPMKSALLPLGGLLAGHKGYCLSLIVDILSGALSGNGCSTGEQVDPKTSGFFALVIDPEHFVTQDKLVTIVEELIANLKKQPLMDGFEEIMIPGERLALEREKRLKTGINIDDVTWRNLEATFQSIGIPFSLRELE